VVSGIVTPSPPGSTANDRIGRPRQHALRPGTVDHRSTVGQARSDHASHRTVLGPPRRPPRLSREPRLVAASVAERLEAFGGERPGLITWLQTGRLQEAWIQVPLHRDGLLRLRRYRVPHHSRSARRRKPRGHRPRDLQPDVLDARHHDLTGQRYT
jgi:hypothetical protein